MTVWGVRRLHEVLRRSNRSPLESIAETHPKLQPARLRLSAMISQYFTRHLSALTKWRREQLNLTASPTAGTRHGPAWARINGYYISNVPNGGIKESRGWCRDRFSTRENLFSVRSPGVRHSTVLVADSRCLEDALAGSWLRCQGGSRDGITRIGSSGDCCFDDRANILTTVPIASVQRRNCDPRCKVKAHFYGR